MWKTTARRIRRNYSIQTSPTTKTARKNFKQKTILSMRTKRISTICLMKRTKKIQRKNKKIRLKTPWKKKLLS